MALTAMLPFVYGEILQKIEYFAICMKFYKAVWGGEELQLSSGLKYNYPVQADANHRPQRRQATVTGCWPPIFAGQIYENLI